MATEHNPSGRRPHYHRGRRGTDRRGSDRRSQQPPEQPARPSAEADVEQIMREIRSRISQRHGIDLSPQQIQDLAARRLDAILDPRTVNPTLLDQLRKGAAAPPDPLPPATETDYSLSDDAIYAGSAVVRFFRRLLNPFMKLLFDPAPLIAALQAQTRINRDAAARAADLERRQTEWNALHYEILQRLVTEVSRTGIEMQALGTRLESLAARIDFNDKRIRTLENTPPVTRPQQRPLEPVPVATAAIEPAASGEATPAAGPGPAGDVARRRRRRRRGRRGTPPAGESATTAAAAVGAGLAEVDEQDDEDDATNGAEAIVPTAGEPLAPQSVLVESVETSTLPPSPSPEPAVRPTFEQPASPETEQPATTASPSDSKDSGAPEN